LPERKPWAPAYSPWSEANTMIVSRVTSRGSAARTSPIRWSTMVMICV
jgi:hypothetical protein